MRSLFLGGIAVCCLVMHSAQALADQTHTSQTHTNKPRAQQPLTAEQSDPRHLGWMQGFPPPVDKRIQQPESDFFSFPKMRWTVCHIRELMPTKQVSRGLTAPVPLSYALDDGIDAVTFTPTGANSPMRWDDSLAHNYTDGILILHNGQVVYEEYSGCLNETGKHAAMSMTKSLIGLLAEMLVSDQLLDPDASVASIIPALKDSAFGNASAREVMDMTTSLNYSEDYADPNADIWQYSKAASPLPKARDYRGPNGYFDYLTTVKSDGKHGKVFAYKTVNTDVLGWIISTVSGQDVASLLSERLWRPLGMEQDAYMTVDGIGTPFAGGGLSAGLRDLGRLGLLLLNDGMLQQKRLVKASVIDSIRQGGDKNAFAQAGYKSLPGGSYRSMWWVLHNAHGAYAARGVHGQTLYIDPTANMVIVRFASHPTAKNSANDPTSLPAYQAVAEYLMQQSMQRAAESNE
ncbi:serine hydrolase domain-containing protein [Bacterioplanes sanyensis]|nr:serine hydrolase [Bacterioplanes sanyensis]